MALELLLIPFMSFILLHQMLFRLVLLPGQIFPAESFIHSQALLDQGIAARSGSAPGASGATGWHTCSALSTPTFAPNDVFVGKATPPVSISCCPSACVMAH